MKQKQYLTGFACLILLLGLDQLTKKLAVANLQEQPPVPIFKGVFELQYLENRGAAFGLLQDQRWLLLGFTVLILGLLVFFYLKLPFSSRYLPLRLVGIMVAAGAVGNMIDRLVHGYVVDFLYFKLIDFPIFNVADCYVVISAFLAFFLIGFYYKDEDFAFLKKR
ncbi:MAG: signal peptidase II [Lachnospiraceae bacterium]|jgi:signal peptidase II|nr:signal peptidase II [Lachnospiraceae bacterium]